MSRMAAAVAMTTLIAACATDYGMGSAADGKMQRCTAQVIVTLAAVPTVEPDPALIADLSRVAQVQITYLRSISPGIQVYTLSAEDAEARCNNAIERLRQDARIRSIDLDQRRSPQG
jgi:hypothetical protein